MNPNNRNKAISQQYNADAKLHSEFEQSGNSGEPFDYSKSVTDAPEKPVPDEQVVAYLSKIQRGGFIQSFGFLLAIEETSFKIIAHSENSIDLLGLNNLVESEQLECLIGLDARTFFTQTSGVSLTNVVESSDMSLLNPVWVCSIAQKQFHAILHRIDVGILIDFEPVQMGGDIGFSVSGAGQSQKLAVGAISRLQVLTSGDIGVLCDAVVEEIQKLTGYDRVMVYKFHKDEHGEVLSEVRKPGLEPYLGLHYPATDIPQAARFQFKQNQVRMIVDCIDSPIRIIQSEDLEKPLILTKSTLRSPHPCHAVYMENMGSIASLVMAIVVNDGSDTTKLWGLVACHHCSARYIAYPLRYACQFVMQIFGLQLSMKIRLESQLIERKKFKIQTLLCDLLSKDVPFGVVTQTPNIMDLVKCNGAALCYNGKIHLLGVTPTEEQIKDIVDWLISYDGDATGLSTDSLSEAGYPGAALICDVVCGLASARIKLNDFLLWFRSQTAKEIKWGGAKHHSKDKDDGEIMHPRSSFKVFLEVVKDRSFPWEVSEINSIHSLQLIMRDLFQNIEDNSAMTMMVHAEQSDSDLNMSIFSSVASEMVRLLETARAPVLAVDSAGIINGWNAKIAELTGLLVSEAMGKSLVHELIHEESRVIVQNRLSRALQGEEEKNIELRLRTFGEKQNNGDVNIVANASISKDYTNNIIGLCFVGQDVTKEKVLIDKFVHLEGDYKAIVQCLNPLIPPIFASDENACCSEWNKAMEKLTGWTRGEVIGKTLPGVIFGRYCRLKDQDAVTKFMIFLYCTLCNEESGNFTFGFYDRNGKYVEAILTANKKTNGNGHVIGCVCFLQTALPDKEALDVQAQQEQLKKLAYLRQEIEKPLKGIQFMTQKLVEATTDRDDQKQFLEIRDECEGEIMSLIENIDLGSIE